MKTLIEKSPTRVDLAGGTLDLWPIHAFLGEVYTVNVAIDIWTEARLTPREDNHIRLISRDVDLDMSFPSLKDLLQSEDTRLSLYQPILNFYLPKDGFTLETSSQSPVGGGLGGSSSLVISLLKVFNKWLGRKMETQNLVSLASNIEAHLLCTPTGTQDYYPPISGGLNILHYQMGGVKQEILHHQMSDLQSCFILVYTGRSHHSGLNNWDVLKRFVENNKATQEALENLADVSCRVVGVCREGRWDDLPKLFNEEYRWRLQLSPSFSSPEIEELKKISLASGASGMKICGAGGGGCVLIWSSPENREQVIGSCEQSGFTVLRTNAVSEI